MREIVKCLNCGLKWERITALYDGVTIELAENLMYNCPNCSSNYYETFVKPLIEEKPTPGEVRPWSEYY